MVKRKYKNLGLGDRILLWIQNECLSRDKHLLRVDCLESNKKLRKYYIDRGFVECGEIEFNDYKGKLFEKQI